MSRTRHWKPVISNLLIAGAISLIVNFSYFVFLIMSGQERHDPHPGPHDDTIIVLELAWYLVLAFVLLTIVTARLRTSRTPQLQIRRALLCVALTAGFYFLTPVLERLPPFEAASGVRGHDEHIVLLAFARRLVNPMLILKSSFTLIVALLYGRIYNLVYQRQRIEIENQKLQGAILQAEYNVLVSQINPHFFFNSLNSLSMLIRERRNEDALVYIDRLSDVFRYIIQSSRDGISTLAEELAFLDSYRYIFEIRYQNKIFFDIRIDEWERGASLPTLSLQPLVENAVKHNAITAADPLHIDISTENGYLVVSNRIVPRIGQSMPGTGIGLSNLASRYELLTGRDIVIEQHDGRFTVRLPLIHRL